MQLYPLLVLYMAVIYQFFFHTIGLFGPTGEKDVRICRMQNPVTAEMNDYLSILVMKF